MFRVKVETQEDVEDAERTEVEVEDAYRMCVSRELRGEGAIQSKGDTAGERDK